MRLNLLAWQFVRIMTWLDANAARVGPASQALHVAWQPRWQEVDAQLEALGAADHEAFSEMMMQYLVTLDLPPPVAETRPALRQAVLSVIAELDALLADEPADETLRYGLNHERDALKALAQRLDAGRPRRGGGGSGARQRGHGRR